MIELRSLTKAYGEGEHAAVVLDSLDLTVADGEITAVVGPSGAGKSTLAQCVTLLEHPTSGSVVVDGRDLTRLDERSLREARRSIGTVFQTDGLLSRRTAAQNVELPLRYLGVTARDRTRRVAELLDRVGLGAYASRYPHQLSGGQRQRVGIARALALRPSVLLADEATSGLDPNATASILALLKELRGELGLSVLFITHDMDTVVQIADSVARLDRGRIVESGALVDLLRDPKSALGRALLPRRPHAPTSALTTWFASYQGSAVPRTWLTRASAALGSDLELLGASISEVNGSTVGHATLGVPDHLPAAAVADVLAALGLHAVPVENMLESTVGEHAELEPVA